MPSVAAYACLRYTNLQLAEMEVATAGGNGGLPLTRSRVFLAPLRYFENPAPLVELKTTLQIHTSMSRVKVVATQT